MTTPPPAAAALPTSGKAIAALIVGIVSLFMCFYWFIALPGGIIAIVLGVLARKETSAGTHKGAGMAMTGIIFGAITALLAGTFAVLIYIAPTAFPEGALTDFICEQQPDNEICSTN